MYKIRNPRKLHALNFVYFMQLYAFNTLLMTFANTSVSYQAGDCRPDLDQTVCHSNGIPERIFLKIKF